MTTAERLLDAGVKLIPQTKVISRGERKGEKEETWVPGDPASPWEIVVSAYRRAGLGEEAALVNARVARICRYTDYDFKEKKVKLWNPK
jgi:DNA polymerase-1